MQLIDTHCHLYFEQFDPDVDTVIQNALKSGISKIVVPGIDLDTSRQALDLAQKYESVYAAVGMHPNLGLLWDENSLPQLRSMAEQPKVVAIGEIGLDNHWEECPRKVQQSILIEQLRLASEMNLPVILHSRESMDELLATLTSWKSQPATGAADPAKLCGIFHAFEGNSEHAHKAIGLGFMIGIGGPVTYKNAAEKHELAKSVDLDWLVLETDAPFLAPHPRRGSRNEPQYIKLVAEKIAEIRDKQLKLIAQATTNNANRMFAWES